MEFTKIKKDKKQVIIQVNSLIPYGNYSFDLFRGRRLCEMVNNIKKNGVCCPIIVRPVSEGKYEILDGHYRVKAAKKLKIKTIYAQIQENLSDENALTYLSETNPIGLLEKHGVDINKYIKTKKLSGLENTRIFCDDYYSMALDEYIERFLLDVDEVELLYSSVYDMGNPYELKRKECEYIAIAREIVRMNEKNLEVKNEIEDWKKLRGLGDIRAVESAQNAMEEDAKEKINLFVRKDNGYLIQLKRYLNIDLSLFDYRRLKNKRERAKIIYFMHSLKTKEFPQHRILEMLSKPSLENSDNSFLGWKTNNGEFINAIMCKIEKEISLELKENVKKAVSYVVNNWGELMEEVRMKIEILENCDSEYEAEINSIKFILAKPFVTSNPKNKLSTFTSPLELLYFRLVQREYLGQMEDLLKIYEMQEEKEYDVPREYIDVMRQLEAAVIEEKDIDAYFEVKNVQRIAPLVYLKAEISKEERRRIRDSKEKVIRFINFCDFGRIGYDAWKDVTELLIISCLQEIVLDKNNEILDYTYYGYEGNKNKRRGKIYVQAALKGDDRVSCNILKIYWVHKVVDRSYANVGKNNMRKDFREIEKLCIQKIKNILGCYTIEEMLSMHSYYWENMHK